MTTSPEAQVKVILDTLLQQENKVLEFWTRKKKQLDQCQQFVLFERSAKQVCVTLKFVLYCIVCLNVTVLKLSQLM